ncbi:MAG: sulfite exporter TauE/SafE family protein [Oscillospiraceae bacterium]|nr:sulfite exporter TauE/SafE family protein [Oscillospiraceae bacterium]
MNFPIKCAIIGAAAGIVNGIFGAGGGMILVPLLSKWAGLDYKSALATSVAVILPVSVSSALVYIFGHGFDFLSAVPYALGGLLGGFIGGRVFKKVSVKWMRRIFALFVIYGGVKNLL